MRANRLLVIVATTVSITVGGGSVAGANPIGPPASNVLTAFSMAASTGAPNVLTWADFTGANGTTLSGTALNGPGTWIVTGGTWTIQNNAAATTNVALARMDTDVGTQNATALAALTFGASAKAGLVALDNGTNLVYALYSTATGGTITLSEFTGSTVVLGTVTGIGTPASAAMKLDASTNTLKVSFAGTVVLSYALTAAEITALKGATNTRFGLMANKDTVTRFDDFHVDN